MNSIIESLSVEKTRKKLFQQKRPKVNTNVNGSMRSSLGRDSNSDASLDELTVNRSIILPALNHRYSDHIHTPLERKDSLSVEPAKKSHE